MSPEASSPQQAILQFLTSLQSPARILVAISGGSDSTGLLFLLDEALKAAPDLKISLCAATVDHALRSGSADEAREVAALCASLGIPHTILIWQGDKPKTGMMAAAREARYDLLAAAAKNFKADLIVTGHTFDDQRETLAMRGLRSEQVSTGIADAVLFDRHIWIMRPLLGSRRADIRAYLKTRGISWLDDPSNEDVTYERVRMRQRLAEEVASKAGAETEGQRLLLAADAAAWLDLHFRLHGGVLGHISPDGLRAEAAVLNYALGRLAAVFGGRDFPPGGKQMDGILAFIAAAKAGRMTAGRVVFDLRRSGLYLARESRGILPLSLQPGERSVWDGRFEVVNNSPFGVRIEAAGMNARTGAAGSPKREEECSASIEPRRSGSYDEHSIAVRWDDTLPKAALKRATAALPVVLPMADIIFSDNLAGRVRLTPYSAPFDRFLTRFDFIFANRLSAVFATAPYARLPLRSIDGKTI